MNKKENSGRGRKYKFGEPLVEKYEVKFTESQNKKIEKWQQQAGVPEVSDLFRDTLLEKASNSESGKPPPPDIPLLGVIPAGELDEIKQELPGQFIRPPFDTLKTGDYALKVCGHSMEAELGMTIGDGAFVIMRPNVIFPHAIVHVEFSNGQFEHTVTLKKYVRLSDGNVEFRPLNAEFKTIRAKEGEFTIRGGMVEKWEVGKPEEKKKAK